MNAGGPNQIDGFGGLPPNSIGTDEIIQGFGELPPNSIQARAWAWRIGRGSTLATHVMILIGFLCFCTLACAAAFSFLTHCTTLAEIPKELQTLTDVQKTAFLKWTQENGSNEAYKETFTWAKDVLQITMSSLVPVLAALIGYLFGAKQYEQTEGTAPPQTPPVA